MTAKIVTAKGLNEGHGVVATGDEVREDHIGCRKPGSTQPLNSVSSEDDAVAVVFEPLLRRLIRSYVVVHE